MRKFLKVMIIITIVIYLLSSAVWSIWYNTSDRAWEVAQTRNGLLVMGFDDNGWWILSPFNNYGDVFLFGFEIDEEGYTHTYSDGFYSFGEWF